MGTRRSAVPRTPTMTAVAVAVLLAAVGCGSAGTVVQDQVRAPRSSSPSPVARTVTWDGMTFEVPTGWTVNDTHETWPHLPAALLEGPFLGTLRTGPMCWTNRDGSGGCGRGHGILERRPADGVVAWVDAGTVGPMGATGDPGPAGEACPGRARTFHAYRELRVSGVRLRVAVDGCAYGKDAAVHLQELRQLAASVRPA